MAGPLFDVFVVGSKDPSPVAQMHLAAALAGHFQVPVTQVAQAVAARNLRAGQGLDQAQAQALAQNLAGFGAVTEFRPSLAVRGGSTAVQMATPTAVGGATATRTTGTMSAVPSTAVGGPSTRTQGPATMAPHGTDMRLPSLSNSTTGTHQAVNTRATMAPLSSDTGPLPLPHQLPTGPLKITGELRALQQPQGTPVGRDPFLPPEDQSPGGGKLELLKPPSRERTAVEEMTTTRPSHSMPGASGMNSTKLAADSDDSGLEIADDPNKLHTVRCPIHGLYYDKRKASGCRKCLKPSKDVASQIVHRQSGEIRMLSMRDDPVKRAFMGLALAMILGFLPAAYSAMRVGAKDVSDLRAEQEVLSQKVGTEQTLKRFDEIEGLVDEARGKSMRNTLIIWIAVSGVVMGAWYKIT